MFRFRLAPTRHITSARTSAALPGKLLLLGALALLAAGGMGGWMLGHHREKSGEVMQDTGPVVLAIRQIGQLHTASFQMKDVLQEETQNEPADWAKPLPGAEGLTHWATHNQALVVAQGTVEAGVDLSRLSDKDVREIRLPNGTMGLQVHLPPVEIYPVNVEVHVEDLQSGLFWRDDNIVPKAQAQAASRFTAAAEKEHIREKAQAAAIESLQKLMRSLHRPNVEFAF